MKTRSPQKPAQAAEAAADTVELVAAATAGRHAAWEQLVDRYGGLVWAIARGHRLSSADAADVVQTTWLRLVENLHRLHSPERVGAWLATTARHESLRVLRGGARVVPSDDETVLDRPSVAPDGPEQGLIDEEEATRLWEAVDSLPPRCRSLLRVLMADPAPSYEEVSRGLGMPVGASARPAGAAWTACGAALAFV